ncbi:sulfatase [Nocardioides sp. R-C-SC26]|uniref:sulfatase family protein n=1 Tax=Nocardioides sp. R-C-SC26 TaxID=2870414 RepID=UPI001E40C741|nr:sulfatase [Nocardioides sp. R-C-SC26]
MLFSRPLPRPSQRILATVAVIVMCVVALVLSTVGGYGSNIGGLLASATPSASESGDSSGEATDEETAPAEVVDRPNIVLITTDDMTVTDLRWMPVARDLLTRAGVSFDRALSPHPLCCPARGAILTGQYAQNNGVKSNQPPYNFQALQSATALPVWLENAGYKTGFTGKYLNGFGTDGPRQEGWTYWDPTMIGHYAYTPFQMYNDGDRRWYPNINNIDYINQRTSSLVEEWAGQDAPFFIWASHVAPHGRFDAANGFPSSAIALPPKRYENDFANVESPSLSDPGYTDDDVSDNNSLVQSKSKTPREKINEIFRSRIRTLQAVDDGIADLIETLRSTGELDNTYIFFTSDNGYLVGEHHLVTKNVPYRQSIRVPMIVRGPDVPAGVVRQQRALMIDLAPTFADIAGATPLVEVDGESMLPAIEGDAPLRTTVLIQAGPSKQTDDGGAGWWWRGVTTPRYTYAYFYGDRLEELYDRQSDPAENVNLAEDPRYAAVVAEMRERTLALVDCIGPAECSRDFGPDPVPSTS